ncbi:MAG: hypothetical protein HY349_00715 [Nitrospirae bacterium]|nr:hypothetical protein [Nitrospirota bacterium]
MKRIIFGLIVVGSVMVGSWAMAQTGGGGMMAEEGHRYGAMGGYLWLWGLYGLLKAAVVVIGLWLLLRITKAVEKIASSKS